MNFSSRLDGKYSKSELMGCRAFIAFSHAEVEFYLESLATKILLRVESEWVKRNKASKAIAALMIYRVSRDFNVPDDPKQPSPQNKLDTIINQTFSAYRAVIKRNNGLKPINISELFIPLGMMPSDIEETLTIQLTNFGNKRGELVHSSSQVSLPSMRDPFKDELDDVSLLVIELRSFDDSAMRLA